MEPINPDPFNRRVGRSHFFLSKSLFTNITRSVAARAEPSMLGKLAPVLGGLGIGAVITGLINKRREEQDVANQVADTIDKIGSDTDEELKGSTDGLKTLSKDMKPEELKARPATEDFSLWTRIKSMFSWSSPTPAPPSQIVGATTSVQSAPTSVLGEKLSNDFRVQYVFSGFKGAEGLNKGGRFTNDEAQTVNSLKRSKANTSASGGMSKDIEDLIRGYARKYGVDEGHALNVAKMESGGNPNAISSTGAIGIYQFTGRTASEWGIRNRFNAAENIEAGIKFMASSDAKLKSRGLSSDPTAQYLVHQLGLSGATELLRAASADKRIDQLSKPLQKAIRLNAGGKSAKTAKEYIQITQSKLEPTMVAAAPPGTATANSVKTVSSAAVVQTPRSAPTNTEPQVAQVDFERVKTQGDPQVVESKTATQKAKGSSGNDSASKPQVTDVVRTRNGLTFSVG